MDIRSTLASVCYKVRAFLVVVYVFAISSVDLAIH